MLTDDPINTLSETGSVTISNEIEIKETDYGKFLVTALLPNTSSEQRLFYLEDKPTASDIDAYKKSIDTVERWESDGYDSVNGWEYLDRDTMGRRIAKWETAESRYIKINSADFFTIDTSMISKMFTAKYRTAASNKKAVELATAFIFHSFTPRQFEYQFQKYLSMFRNLGDITGIGDSTSHELLVDFECETYEDAKQNLLQTNIPKNYLREASSELADKVNSDESLIDPSVTKEYSDIVVSSSI